MDPQSNSIEEVTFLEDRSILEITKCDFDNKLISGIYDGQ